MVAPRAGAADLQPADARDPGSPLRLRGLVWRAGLRRTQEPSTRSATPSHSSSWHDLRPSIRPGSRGAKRNAGARCRACGSFAVLSQRALLRPRRDRPRDRRAAEQSPELAPPHSITSSARASSAGEISRPSALAVCRLTTNSNLVDCKTGRSAGFAPLRI